MSKMAGFACAGMLMAAGWAMPATMAGAQTPEGSQTEITVEAPRSVPMRIERNPYTGAAIAVTTVRMSVLYGDLDLTAPRDADRLMLRVRNVARDACKQLDRLFPLDPDETCIDKAVDNAAPLATAAIAAARGR